MTLPLLVSVPHAGLRVPAEVERLCALTPQEVAADGDGGAAEIYAFEDEVGAFVTTDVARAVIDMNRSRDDIRADGVVKTHTCWNVPVWNRPLSQAEVDGLLDEYHRPYHERLTELGRSGEWMLGVDCHTMAATGPPLGPDPGTGGPGCASATATGPARRNGSRLCGSASKNNWRDRSGSTNLSARLHHPFPRG